MPELPEVETLRRGLDDLLKDHPVIRKVRLTRKDIRFEIPKDFARALEGHRFLGVRRRAKYILFDTDDAILLSHLGMTGSWRVAQSGDETIHDHCFIELSDGRTLVFRDPRRFGVLDLVRRGKESKHKLLDHLGPEPLDETAFDGASLYAMSRKRKVAVKVFVMNQEVVVGVGNIYASEALFRAKIRPQKAAGRLTRHECERGSSIRDYRQASGEAGGFQDAHRVYDRGGEPCVVCRSKIRSKVMGGRSTYWCSTCQK
ncbi:MAG: bifunctional DNA-formamidopyrimidine glycosylase/DNA-(apurinic or apyrimidinic site) lyase [Bdellovibrionota bacterium]